MALKYVDTVHKCGVATPCEFVYVCLSSEWANRTKTGFPLVQGRVLRVGTYVTQYEEPPTCSQDPKTICMEECAYHVEINDNQFIQNPATDKPYEVVCDDILELTPYPCHIQALINATTIEVDGLHLDTDAIEVVSDAGVNTTSFNLPVIHDATGLPHSSANVVIPGGAIENKGSATLGYTSGPGKETTVNLCEMITGCMDGTSITKNVAGKFQVNPAASYDPDIAYNDSCGSSGFITGVSINNGVWTFTRSPGHTSYSKVASFSDRNYTTETVIGALESGNSGVRTPAYVEDTFVNPSPCRSLKVGITATGGLSFATLAGTGLVVWGHSLWINGALVNGRNGRGQAGYNVSEAIHSGQMTKYTLPTMLATYTIPPGGSVTIGLDFGDNDVFTQVGRVLVLSLESRAIMVVGSTV